MKYSELLKVYIKNSRYTLEEISLILSNKGLSASREHLSRLQNGKVPPASDELNRAICEIVDGNLEKLLISAYLEKIPEEIRMYFKIYDQDFKGKTNDMNEEEKSIITKYRNLSSTKRKLVKDLLDLL